MRHNHVTRDIKAPGICPACDELHGVRKYGSRQIVNALEAKRLTKTVDILALTEERVLTELVRTVYRDGFVGIAWPTLTREAYGWTNGELIIDRANPEEWHIEARVKAMPR